MSIVARPPSSAASRATLPALWPCRTIQSVCGHFCSKALLFASCQVVRGVGRVAHGRFGATDVPRLRPISGCTLPPAPPPRRARPPARGATHERPLLPRRAARALVTGGSRGIGRMIAAGFLRPGARVYISSRKAEACDATARELSALGTCVSLPADVSTREGVQALVAAYRAARADARHPRQQRRRRLGRDLRHAFPRRAGTRSST